ncbi:MAG: hypothetical protein ABUS79_30775, partial [Pseudomonadota bacterium]
MHHSHGARALSLLSISIALAAGCGFKPAAKSTAGTGGQPGVSTGPAGPGTGGSVGGGAHDGGAADVPHATACNPCSDFPTTPILDAPAGATPPPASVADTFGAAGTGAAS